MRCFFAGFVIMIALAQGASGQTNEMRPDRPPSMLHDPTHPKVPPAPQSYYGTQAVSVSIPADFDDYVRALQRYVSEKVSPHGFAPNPTPAVTWVQLAMADPTLAKSPNLKRLTLGLLNEGRNMEMVEKRLADQARAASAAQSSSRQVVPNNNSNYDPRRPPKPPEFPGQKEMEAMNKMQSDAQRQRTAISAAADKWLKAIQALAGTPEAQQFALPKDSAFYQKLSSGRGATVTPGGQVQVQGAAEATRIRVEVTSQVADGVMGYLKKLVRLPNGDSLKGSDGEFVYEADRTKTVVITGYPETATFGDSLEFKARKGDPKVVYGQTLPQYIYVSE